MRLNTYGDAASFASIVRRLDEYSEPDLNGGCRLWSGYTDKHGYGSISAGGRPRRAHRVAWEVFNGPIPDGLHVCHRCDVRACINTKHLFLGTNAENIADRDAKGRKADQRGERCGMARLTEDNIKTIYERLDAGELQRVIARDFGVASTTVSDINRGRSWPHMFVLRRVLRD